jgi:hypothetical protein
LILALEAEHFLQENRIEVEDIGIGSSAETLHSDVLSTYSSGKQLNVLVHLESTAAL